MVLEHIDRLKESRDQPPSGGGVPSERPARWRRPLLLVHRTLDHAFRLADAAKRSADEAEQIILSASRANAARDCLTRAWVQLAEAGHRATTSEQYLSNALALAAASPEEGESIQPLFTAAFQDVADALEYITQVCAYVQAVADHFHGVTILQTGGAQFLASLREYLPKPAEPADPRFDYERPKSPPSSAYAEGFRRVTRGRSPPRQRTAVLHAVSTAAERPVCLRSLS
jgi:hypothetical protein